MICRQRLLRQTGGLVLLTALMYGCSSGPPTTVETSPPVTVSKPLVREIVEFDDYEGRIAAVDNVEVRARVRGHLTKVHFKDGQMVDKGDLLFEIDPRPYQATLDAAKAQLVAAESDLKHATIEHERAKKLAEKGAGPKKDEDKWLAEKETAAATTLKATAEVERAKLEYDYSKAYSPIRGKTSKALVSVGNLVNAGGGETLLTTITSVDPMHVYFDVDERALLRYRKDFQKKATNEPRPPIKDLNIPIEVALDGDEGHPRKGVIDFADNRVNPNIGTIQVRGELSNADRMLDHGMRARVRVPVSEPHKVLMITPRALGTDQSRRFVWVVNAQDVVERRDVTLGRLVDGLQVIQEGLTPDDRVVVNGIQRVRDGTKVTPQLVPMPGTPPAPSAPPTKN